MGSCSSPTTWAWSPRRRERVGVQYAGQKVEEQEVTGLFADPHHPYTAALLAALPERAHSRRLPSIPGVVPGQFDRPTGCLFSPRCRFATESCRHVVPQAGSSRARRCAVPLSAGRRRAARPSRTRGRRMSDTAGAHRQRSCSATTICRAVPFAARRRPEGARRRHLHAATAARPWRWSANRAAASRPSPASSR